MPLAKKAERTRLYFTRLLPTFKAIKHEADAVLDLNQKNMEDESTRARSAATHSTRLMALALLGSAVIATVIAVGLSRSILEPIRSATRAAKAMAAGDLDQVVPVLTRDELGEIGWILQWNGQNDPRVPSSGDRAAVASAKDSSGDN